METTLVPSWLDKEFIQSAIREKEGTPDVVVTSLDVRAALGKGENYASTLLRITAHLTDDDGGGGERHLIVKMYPSSEVMQTFLDRCRGFERETKMYHVTVPAMSRLLAPLDLPPLSATPYPMPRPRTLLMPDLTHEGYKMADRHRGLDASQGDLALRTLARFHASSLILMQRDPSAMEDYLTNFYIEDIRDMVTSMFKPLVATLLEQVGQWPGFEHLSSQLRDHLVVDNIITLFKPTAGETVVLNHGDCWVNNLLFKVAEDDVAVDVRVVDLQEMHVGSPAIDLLYLLYTSLWADVLQGRTRTLLRVYHGEFVDVLQRSRVELPEDLATVTDLEEKFREKISYGLWAASTILPIVVADPADAVDFGSKENDHFHHCAATRYKDIFQKLLLHFQEIGVLK